MRVVVDVWRIDLVDLPPPSARDIQGLCEAERTRHASYLAPEPARIFAVTRLALRRLLAERTGLSAEHLRIAVGEHGKPFLEGVPTLSFNVSHCRSTALIALCESCEIGVDVEVDVAAGMSPRFVSSLCTSEEARWLRDHPALATAAAQQLWCRKEAVLKAWGIGLGHPMACLALGDPSQSSGVVATADSPRMLWGDVPLEAPRSAAVALVSATATSLEVRAGTFPGRLAAIAHAVDPDDLEVDPAKMATKRF